MQVHTRSIQARPDVEGLQVLQDYYGCKAQGSRFKAEKFFSLVYNQVGLKLTDIKKIKIVCFVQIYFLDKNWTLVQMAFLMKWSRFINFLWLFLSSIFLTSSNQSCRAIQRLTYDIAIFGASAPAFAPIVVKCVSRLMLNPTFIGASDLF